MSRGLYRVAVCLAFAVMVRGVFAALVEWDFPRAYNCHEGMAFADGKTGVLVWGGNDTINLTVGRADLWDHRGGYQWTSAQNYTNIVSLVQSGKKSELLALFKKETPDGEPRNPYMLPLGRVVVKVLGRTLKHGSLDPFTGLGVIEFAEGGKLELAMSKRDYVFAMRFSDGIEYEVKSVPATDREPFFTKQLAPYAFKKARVIDGLAQKDVGGFRWELPADAPVSLWWRRNDRELTLGTGRGADITVASVGYASVADASVAYWTKFWERGARVKVPDAQIQRVFDYGMYRFGAMTDPDGVPAGLQGPWLEDDKLVPWNGDYHFNINVQECYSPAYRGGHFENLIPLFRMVLGWRPLLRENARKFVGINDGYVLPHSVDDRGVCIGGFWTGTIDHASTAWVAAMMMKYVRYSGDVEFLKSDAYDFMKGAMNVYRAMMEERDGKLSMPLGPSPEWCGSDVQKAVGRDPSFQLAAAHRLARDLIDAAKILGEKADPMWLDVEQRLPQFTAGKDGLQLFAGQELTESHRHHSHMAGLYPFDTIDIESNTEMLKQTYAIWHSRGTSQWTGWCVPWAAILNVHYGHSRAAVSLLRDWDDFFCDEGHGSHHNGVFPGFTGWEWGREIMQMDGQCAAATAVMELMVHEINGKVEFFRGCPDYWKDVSFENIALSDGTRVSARRVNGEVTVTRAP